MDEVQVQAVRLNSLMSGERVLVERGETICFQNCHHFHCPQRNFHLSHRVLCSSSASLLEIGWEYFTREVSQCVHQICVGSIRRTTPIQWANTRAHCRGVRVLVGSKLFIVFPTSRSSSDEGESKSRQCRLTMPVKLVLSQTAIG